MGRKIFVFLIVALFVSVAYPLIFPLAMGAILAVVFSPWTRALERRHVPAPVASALLSAGITLVILVPASFLIFLGAKNGIHQLQVLKQTPSGAGVGGTWIAGLLAMPKVHGALEWVTRWFPVRMEDLADATEEAVRAVGLKVAEMLANLITFVPGMLLALVVTVVSVFFFLLDGWRAVEFVRKLSVFSPRETERILASLDGICRSVILASVVSGMGQALLEVIFCVATGTPQAALIGLLVFLGSFIPILGSAPVTFGVALQQLLADRPTAALVLAIGAVSVAVVDNFIRPWFLKGSANLHPLLAFVAALGGLGIMGFPGVFLGPIIAALFLVVMDLERSI